ncbi:MAG: TonB-dependent receptor [Prolixibacteraceae bacterium]|jgi:TonB-linked SusC/RagA family outer membrane protein|nr:TonB-dependent receptor [Prolixibacteraceae bacterium]
MKLTSVFFLMGLLQLSASVYSQQTKLSLTASDMSVREIIDRIEEQSNFKFLYRDEVIDADRKVSMELKGNVEEVLKKVFVGTDVFYRFLENNLIVLTTPTEQAGSSKQSQLTISGKVTDSSGSPLPGVTVVVKGTTQGTITDTDGNYSLPNVPGDATLVFSFVGMQTQEIAVAGKTDINIMMEEDAIGIEEVVAIGYGTQKKINLTGSVATVSSEELTVAPVASTTNALTGRLPGLITKQESGLPGGDAAALSIRGFGAPLVIVDGVESSFNNIAANEIESISVLKDASAAIYGSRAGNGVILVTTKRGNISKPIINLQSNYTIQGITFLPKLCNSGQQAELELESHFNQGLPASTAPWIQEEVDLLYAGTNPDYPNTNWFKLAANDWAPQHQHHLSVRGGSDKVKYYGFIGYLDQLSFFKNNGGEYQRYNIRSNIDAKITDKLSIQCDFSSVIENRDFPFRAQEQQSSLWQEYWTSKAYFQGELPDKTKIANAGIGAAVSLPVMTNSKIGGYRKTDSQNIKGTLAATYDFSIKGLSARAFVNYDQNYNDSKSWDWLVDSWTYNNSNDTYTQVSVANNRGLTYNIGKNRTLTGQVSLNFNRTFAGDHHVTALVLYEVIDFKSMGIYAFRDGQKTYSLDYAFAGSLANQKVNDGASEMGRTSYIGRLNYDFKSKYLLESTLRVDKSAKFSPDERVGVFPSISLGWRISEENFMKESVPALENMKLRASFSKTGNDAVGNFQYLSGYRYGEIYLIGSNPTAGLVATGLANPLLTWEEMTIYNVGLDFGLKQRVLYGELDFFYRERDGIPGKRVRSLPDTFGAELPTENLNNINTRGFELNVGNVGRWKDLRWDISANVSWARSKWGFFDEPEYDDQDEERLYKRTGKWTDIDYGYVSDGLFTSQEEIDALNYVYDETQGNVSIKPGDVRYKDINNDGILNWRDQVEIGKGTMPHWMVGINLNLNYKNFDMQALFQGALGFTQKINLFPGSNYSVLVYDERWTPENNQRNGLVPRLGGASSNKWNSDFNYMDSDYLRLKTFSLGYNLPKLLMQHVGIENLRLYIAGTNLFTISQLNKYTIDPEGKSGWTGYYYPQMRTITLGLNLSL